MPNLEAPRGRDGAGHREVQRNLCVAGGVVGLDVDALGEEVVVAGATDIGEGGDQVRGPDLHDRGSAGWYRGETAGD